MLGHRHPWSGRARAQLLLFAPLAVAIGTAFYPAAARAQSAPSAQNPPPLHGAEPASSPSPSDNGALLPATPNSVPAPSPPPAPPPTLATPPATPPPSAFLPIDPHGDQLQLAQQGHERPTDGSIGVDPRDVYSEDWWGRARPIFEIHGYFRTRGYLFHNFNLGRHDPSGVYTPGNQNLSGSHDQLWAPPIDNSFTSANGNPYSTNLCGPMTSTTGTAGMGTPCADKSQSSANLRFRINPELSISDNLRIVSQLDLLNNLVLGSTSNAYAMQPGTTPGTPTGATTNGYVSAGYNPQVPASFFTSTQGSPTAGVNSFQNAVNVNRVWAEYMTPVGELRFGRMPNQWGLGMVNNSGDGIDSDYQSTIDRIMFVTGIKSWDLYAGGSWDFPATGPTNSTPFDVYGGQPVNTCNLCNLEEWMLFVAHRTNPEMQKLKLAHGDLVVNGGVQTTYKRQYLDVASNGSTTYTPLTVITNQSTANAQVQNNDLTRRDAWAIVPDAWVQALWGKLRIEGEFAAILGDINSLPGTTVYNQNALVVQEFGLVTETEYRAVEDKLHLNFGFGWASGDPWVQGLNPSSSGIQPELNSTAQNPGGPMSTFAFHPDYRVDLIFFRNILTRVEGAYYFRPSVDYDFIRQPNGQKFGGGAAVIWSRASQFEQTPGHARDLGLELDARVYYQAKDGSLNDDPTKVGGFYSMLQYGVFFPLAGLNYQPGEQSSMTLSDWGVSPAQTVQLFLGVIF